MMRVSRAIATAGGLGYSPVAPGTVGSLLAVALWWMVPLDLTEQLIAGAVFVVAGTWAAGRLERQLRQTDPSFIVIDEVAGMWLALAGLPKAWLPALLAFAAFRLFDIVKLPPVRQLERLPGGYGIMADDLAASILARLVTLLVLRQVS